MDLRSRAAADATPAPAPAASESAERAGEKRRRKPLRGKKPAGSKWLNRLLALGCCASLVPLGLEWYWTSHHREDHLPKPHKDDPWVRVIDAAPPEDSLTSSNNVRKRWRHHPRHASTHAKVQADGTFADLDEEETMGNVNGTARAALASLAVAAAAAADAGLESRIPVASEALLSPPPAAAAAATAAAASAASATLATGASAAPGGTRGSTAADTTAAAAASAGASTAAESANATATPHVASASHASDDDELRSYFRHVDAATAPRARSGANGTTAGGSTFRSAGLGGRAAGSAGGQRLFRAVPGGIHDIIEGDGPNATTFSVEGIRAPMLLNGSYVADPHGFLDQKTIGYLNRNLSWVDRLTPFRVLLVVLPLQPRDWNARRLYAAQLIRHWYGMNRMYDRTALIVLSRDGLVEISVGRQCRMVFSEAIARHFASRAIDLLASRNGPNATGTEPSYTLFSETAQKLVFYVSFTVRSRTQATALSMRSMSMFMMLFMMMTITVTKQQQARRYAEMYGTYPYGGGLYGSSRLYGGNDFWDEFEMGRRGGRDPFVNQLAEREEAFFRMHILSMLLSQRGHAVEEEDDEDEDEDFDEEEEEALLLQAQQSFYEEERQPSEGRACGNGGHRAY